MILFIFLHFASQPALAKTDASAVVCVRKSLAEISRPEFLDSKFHAVPRLRTWTQDLLADPAIPKNVKRVIQRGLDEDVEIFEFTQELRNAIGLDEGFKAVHIRKNQKFRTAHPNGPKTINQIGSEKINDSELNFEHRHTLLLQQRPTFTKKQNDLIALVHELSHVKFDRFLEDHLENLTRKFPGHLIKKMGDGTYTIDQHLYDFLSERYAHETEYSVLSAAYGRHFDEWFKSEVYLSQPGKVSDDDMKNLISDYVIRVYKINSPAVRALKYKSLSQILNNGI